MAIPQVIIANYLLFKICYLLVGHLKLISFVLNIKTEANRASSTKREMAMKIIPLRPM